MTGLRRLSLSSGVLDEPSQREFAFVGTIRVLQEWGEEQSERHANWTELFFDIVYVAILGRLGDDLRDADSSMAPVHYILLFCPLFFAWQLLTGFYTRFEASDGLQFSLDSLTFIFLCGAGMNTVDGLGHNLTGYAVCCSGTYVALSITYFRLLWSERTFGLGCRMAASVFLTAVLFAIAAAMTTPTAKQTAYVAAVGITFLSAIIMPRLVPPKARIPVHVDHMNERFGCFMMVFLGEAAVDIVASAPEHVTWDNFVSALFGVLFLITVKLLYFDIEPMVEERHALRTSALRGQLWWISHMILFAGIGVAGSAMELVASTSRDNARSLWLLCGSNALIHLALAVIQEAHQPLSVWGNFTNVSVGIRIVTAALCAVTPLVITPSLQYANVATIGTMLLFAVMNAGLDALFTHGWLREKHNETKRALEEQRKILSRRRNSLIPAGKLLSRELGRHVTLNPNIPESLKASLLQVDEGSINKDDDELTSPAPPMIRAGRRGGHFHPFTLPNANGP